MTIKNSECIEYKNIYLLRRFISTQGKILSRRINKVSSKQQRYITKSIKRSRNLGILPFTNKEN